MSSRTHGDWFGRDEDDTPTDVHPVVARPIPVAALLKREGHDGPSQEGMTRRTLTGVAAGAVMVFSAAVGSLLLHHSDAPANTVAGASNGDVLAADGAMVATTTPQANPQGLPTSSSGTTTPAANAPQANTTPKTVIHNRTTPSTTTPKAPAATTNPAPATTTPAPTTTTNKNGNGNGQNNSSSTTPATTTSNGGLLGTVTGTVNGVLSSVNTVTNTAFNWFSS